MCWFAFCVIISFLFWDTSKACDPSSKVNFTTMTEGDYRYYEPGGISKCGDGSAFGFVIRKGSVNKVMIEMMGGGACWSYEMCSGTNYGSVLSEIKEINCIQDITSVGLPPNSLLSNPNSPVKDWSVVFVPYCTQDLHMGNNTHTYSNGTHSLTWNHFGANNILEVYQFIYDNFPRPDAILVSGCSAGALGAVTAERLNHHYNVLNPSKADVPIGVFSDSEFGLVTTTFAMQVPSMWGGECVLSHLFEGYENISSINFWNSTLTLERFWSVLLKRTPNMTWLLYSAMHDNVQAKYYREMGGTVDGFESKMVYLLQSLLQYSNLRVFTIHRGAHCFLSGSVAYFNPGFDEWINSSIHSIVKRNMSSLPESVVCEECKQSTATGCDGIDGSGLIEDGCGVCNGNNTACSPAVPSWASNPQCTSQAWLSESEIFPYCSNTGLRLSTLTKKFKNFDVGSYGVCAD